MNKDLISLIIALVSAIGGWGLTLTSKQSFC